ncbi:MAG: hypothetical protein IT376_08375 [Polyangiaceae bacterium]|nr:hypothetical protein [Polyangiaceae bacterium]
MALSAALSACATGAGGCGARDDPRAQATSATASASAPAAPAGLPPRAGGGRGVARQHHAPEVEHLFEGAPSFAGPTQRVATSRFRFDVPRGWIRGPIDATTAGATSSDRRAYVGVALATSDARGRELVERLRREARLDEPVWEEPESTRLGVVEWPGTAAHGPATLSGARAEAWVVVLPFGAERLIVVAGVARDRAELRRDVVAAVRSLGSAGSTPPNAPRPGAVAPAPPPRALDRRARPR